MHRISLLSVHTLALALVALVASDPADASRRARPATSPVQLSIIDSDRHDSVLEAHPHGRQHWIAGTPGHRYAIRMTNMSNRRVMVVLSVDGVNAVSGETASPSQSGYVLAPWQTTQVDGWRKSMDEVARFVFTDHARSYATRTGRPADVGVIGIAVFQEAAPPRRRHLPVISRGQRAEADHSEAESSRRSAPAPSATNDTLGNGAMAEQKARQQLGTGHGERVWSQVSQTRFVRASHQPVQITELRYDAESRLVAMGILPRPYPVTVAPRAFPSGFVPDPPWD